MSEPVYLDHAATTPTDPRVIAAMTAVLGPAHGHGNPSAIQHPYGQRAAAAVEAARAQVARLIGATPREIVFTSGATEANNLAIKGACAFYAARGRHLVTALTEHPAVLEPVGSLEAQGWHVTRLRPAADGRIHPDQLAAALRPDTVLVSLMQVNNETGIIHDIAALGAMCRERNVRFHVDAAQSAGRLAIDVETLAVDYLSLSAHKFYGPQGIGALFVRDRPRAGLVAQMHGGGQERERRAGTLAVHQIVGMGAAADIVMQERETEQARLTDLVARLETALADVPDLVWIGSDTRGARKPACQPVGHGFSVRRLGLQRRRGRTVRRAAVPWTGPGDRTGCTAPLPWPLDPRSRYRSGRCGPAPGDHSPATGRRRRTGRPVARPHHPAPRLQPSRM